MIEYLEVLQDQIEEILTNSVETCQVDRITITAGEPPAPAGEDCSAIWLWVDRFEDRNRFGEDCAVRTDGIVNYRIDVCYTVTAEDETDAEHAGSAECLYYLMSTIWCGLVGLKDDGLLMGIGSCERVRLDPLIVGPREGGTVSASGAVVFDYPC